MKICKCADGRRLTMGPKPGGVGPYDCNSLRTNNRCSGCCGGGTAERTSTRGPITRGGTKIYTGGVGSMRVGGPSIRIRPQDVFTRQGMGRGLSDSRMRAYRGFSG